MDSTRYRSSRHRDFQAVPWFVIFSSSRRHTMCSRDWSSDVCSSDLILPLYTERTTRGARKLGLLLLHFILPVLAADRQLFAAGKLHRFGFSQFLGRLERHLRRPAQIGRASCRERVSMPVVAV